MHRSRSASITIRLLNYNINVVLRSWMVHELSRWSAVLYKTTMMTFPIDFPHDNKNINYKVTQLYIYKVMLV